MELNREKIVKALTMFIEDMPADLHLGFTRTVMFRELLQDTLALIREQAEEIERLNKAATKLQIFSVFPKEEELKYLNALERMSNDYKTVRADTVRKMQERLNEKAEIVSTYGNPTMVDLDDINQIAKELLEENNYVT